VLSAWYILAAAGTTRVVTVYAGVPEPGFVTDLDRSHYATESAAWLRRRRADDQAALGIGGCEAVHLNLLEVQFPAYEIPRLRERVAQDPSDFLALVVDEPDLRTDSDVLLGLIEEHVAGADVIYGPAGIGLHPDHRDLAQATVQLAERFGDVRLYADTPYYLFHGLPTWITGESNDRADQWVAGALSTLVADPSRLDQHVVHLEQRTFEQKLTALRCYGTELPWIEADLTGRGQSLDVMRHEAWWRVSGSSH
jgi:LmbE family N-acetylglucosaminyl deacetylase